MSAFVSQKCLALGLKCDGPYKNFHLFDHHAQFGCSVSYCVGEDRGSQKFGSAGVLHLEIGGMADPLETRPSPMVFHAEFDHFVKCANMSAETSRKIRELGPLHPTFQGHTSSLRVTCIKQVPITFYY